MLMLLSSRQTGTQTADCILQSGIEHCLLAGLLAGESNEAFSHRTQTVIVVLSSLQLRSPPSYYARLLLCPLLPLLPPLPVPTATTLGSSSVTKRRQSAVSAIS